jgi:predicted PurR-regulated permease PerM
MEKIIKGDGAPRITIQTIVFGAILLALFVMVIKIITPFFTVLLWSALLYVLAAPLHEKLVRKFNFSKKALGVIGKNLLAAAFAIGTAVIVIVPIGLVILQFYKQFIELLNFLRGYFLSHSGALNIFGNFIDNFAALIDDLSGGLLVLKRADIQGHIVSFLTSQVQYLISFSSNIARNIGNFIISLVFLVFCLFFFYLDGHFLARLFMDLLPIRKDYTTVIVQKFKDTARNLVFGYIIVALFQSVVAYFIFSLFQIKGALVFTVLVFICVFIPMVGGSLVWLPLGISRIVSGDVTGGIIFLIVSGIGISFLDNFVRPMFLQTRIQLHPLIIFFAILGGLRYFGFNGLILGPMLVIIFLTVLDLFLTEHKIEHGK